MGCTAGCHAGKASVPDTTTCAAIVSRILTPSAVRSGDKAAEKAAGARQRREGPGSRLLGLVRGDSAHSLEKKKRLLDKYTLGKVLGQGAFGIVYACRTKITREEYAVKMIDKVESTLADIEREVEMLERLAHPCVVKLHDVYFEKVLVCMVMDLYKGGDMIDGMQRHWKKKGMIAIPVVQNISKMMVQGIAWLHQNSVVHRDVKGDNFLMDREAIEHPRCRIYLSDFGTVIQVPPKQRLKEKCGTNTYWSPEFYDRNYSLGVDMWAIGVVTYGLACARFPFKGETEVRNKVVKCPSRFKTGEDFILGILDRKEASRLTAKQALEHKFLSSIKSAAQVAEALMDSDASVVEFKEVGANAGIQERRLELVERLANAQEKADQGLAVWYKQIKGGFVAHDKFTEKKTKFEWWGARKVKDAMLYDRSAAEKIEDVGAIAGVSDEQEIRRRLEDHGIQTSLFGVGEAKQFAELVRELQNGQSRLMLDAAKHKSLVRVVDLVLIRISHGTGSNKRFLVTVSEQFPDGRQRDGVNQIPGTKKLPHESAKQTIQRVVRDRLNLKQSDITFDWTRKECFEEDEVSHSYPGVRTVYRKEIYEGIMTTDVAVVANVGLNGRSEEGCTFSRMCTKKYVRTFQWLSEAACQTRGVEMRAPSGTEISPLVHAPLGFSEEELQTFLHTNGVDISRNGADGGAAMLKALSEELVKGEAQLLRKPDKTITRLVDVVVLEISRRDGDVIIEMNPACSKEVGRLPAVKRRPDENPFWAAKRVLSKHLKVSENLVQLERSSALLIVEESESKAYPGLPTVYRRLIIPATIQEE